MRYGLRLWSALRAAAYDSHAPCGASDGSALHSSIAGSELRIVPLTMGVVGLLSSECSQQNRANENKHGTHRQHIEIQGKVIGLDSKHSKLPSGRRKTAPAGSRGRSRRNTHRARCFGDGGVGRLGRTATGSPPEKVHPLEGGVEGDAKCQRYKWGTDAVPSWRAVIPAPCRACALCSFAATVIECPALYLDQWVVFGPGGSRTCGFKAAFPHQRLNFCAILSNVAVRSYDGALRSSMVVVGGVEVSSRHLRRRDGARHT
jgi:hypothetical protein